MFGLARSPLFSSLLLTGAGPGGGGGVPAPFLDWQATAGISEAISSTVADWVAAGGQIVEQGTAGARPTHVADFTAGHGLSFDGGDYLSRAGSLVTSTVGSVLIVFNATSVAAKQVLVSQSDQDAANNWFEIGITSEGRIYVESNDAGTVHRVAGSTIFTVGTDYAVFVSHNGDDYFISVNGVEENPLAVESTGTVAWFGDVTSIDTFTIGACVTSGGAARYFSGVIGAVQLWETDLTY